jgi:hypothetical protein
MNGKDLRSLDLNLTKIVKANWLRAKAVSDSWHRYIGRVSRCVPNSRNLDNALLVIYAVNDSIWAKNCLADGGNTILGDNAATLRLCLQDFRMCDEPKGKRLSARWAVPRNVSNNVVQVIA